MNVYFAQSPPIASLPQETPNLIVQKPQSSNEAMNKENAAEPQALASNVIPSTSDINLAGVVPNGTMRAVVGEESAPKRT